MGYSTDLIGHVNIRPALNDAEQKFYASAHWLAYLIDHFLRPGAHACGSDLEWFRGFTFDHEVDGIIAANRRDTRELSLIHVEHNVVFTEVLVPGEPEWPAELLPYELGLDRDEQARHARTARRRVRVIA